MHVSMSAESAVLLLMDKKVGKNFKKKKNWKKKKKKFEKNVSPPKNQMFTFDSHYTAFSLGKCGGNDCRKPDPVGAAVALLDFFPAKKKIWVFDNIWTFYWKKEQN